MQKLLYRPGINLLTSLTPWNGHIQRRIKTQVWIAISVYVLVAILQKELELEASMYEILQVLGVMLFEKTPIKSLFSPDLNNFSKSDLHKQLLLFNF